MTVYKIVLNVMIHSVNLRVSDILFQNVINCTLIMKKVGLFLERVCTG